ncbi:19740_t:CDS:2 [Racocetra fulgida]|uniref:19740_t:CDS:1 n=1 Tax=Racocetra fulgida TaxID=60492 RepID=A0A9N9HEF1_9GLOM|nr:19740_t:CDS:2 [Racocetra fulgida]
MKKLQKKELSETDQTVAITVDKIFQVLDHESMFENNNKDGDTAKLKVSNISHYQPHSKLFLVLTYKKNNQ